MKNSIEVKTVRSYTRTTKSGVEKSMVCVNDTIHISTAQLASAGYTNARAIIGNTMEVEFYAVGEDLLNKDAATGLPMKCTKADSILKSFTIQESALDLQFAKMANAGLSIRLS